MWMQQLLHLSIFSRFKPVNVKKKTDQMKFSFPLNFVMLHLILKITFFFSEIT